MYRNGTSKSEIARLLSIDRKTVRKYLAKDDFSPRLVIPKPSGSSLDPFKGIINEWLEADKAVFYKQRHTAVRVHERLVEQYGFTGGYGIVQRYMKTLKAQRQHASGAEEPLDLIWEPGTAQADFGQADVFIDGELVRQHYFTQSCPHSNDGYTQLFGGEAAECVCQGLKDIFEHVGCVFHTIIFDNATGVGRRIGEIVKESELFARFRAHYGFKARFCNVDSGHEKGSVERKVSYHRKHLLVPAPVITDINTFNAGLLKAAEKLEDKEHYRKGINQHELFKEDIKSALPLPTKPFDVVRYEHVKADGYGHVKLDGCHLYSSSPALARKEVIVAVRAHTVDIIEPDGTIVVTHKRAFGKKRTESIDATTTVRHLSCRPGAWANSTLKSQLPQAVSDRMDALGKDELKRDLELLADAIERSGIEAVFDALDVLAQEHEEFPDFFTVGVLAARIAESGLCESAPQGVNLGIYDEAFLATVTSGGDEDEV
jgi:transposase